MFALFESDASISPQSQGAVCRTDAWLVDHLPDRRSIGRLLDPPVAAARMLAPHELLTMIALYGAYRPFLALREGWQLPVINCGGDSSGAHQRVIGAHSKLIVAAACIDLILKESKNSPVIELYSYSDSGTDLCRFMPSSISSRSQRP